MGHPCRSVLNSPTCRDAARMAPLSRAVAWAYAMPAFSFGAMGVMITVFLPSLYVDEVGVRMAQMGAVSTALQIVDAMTDPFVGLLSDKCSWSWGRRRPLLFGGSLGLGSCFFALFCPPRHVGQTGSLIFLLTVSVVAVMLGTLARVPWLAWGVELTPFYDEKTKLVSIREFGFVVGGLLSAVLPTLLGALLANGAGRLCLAAGLWSLTLGINATCCFYIVPDPQVLTISPATAASNSTKAEPVLSSTAMCAFMPCSWKPSPNGLVWCRRPLFNECYIQCFLISFFCQVCHRR